MKYGASSNILPLQNATLPGHPLAALPAATYARVMADVVDLTVEILKQIRDEVRSTNTGLDALSGEVRSTNTKLEELRVDTNTRLDRHERILEMHSQALGKLIGEVAGLNGRFDNFLTGSHGKAHTELEERVGRIEEWIAKRAS